MESRFNTIVRSTNNGLMIPGGHDVVYHDNVVLATGLADSGARVSSTWGNGLNLVNGYSTTMTNVREYSNRSGFLRWSGTRFERSDAHMPACSPVGSCTGNVSADGVSPVGSGRDPTELDIANAVAAWEASTASASVTIGPRS